MANEHQQHTVQWTKVLKKYHLFCLGCLKFLPYETTTPNRLDQQRYDQALQKPEGVTVTLQVKGLKHRNLSQWRQ